MKNSFKIALKYFKYAAMLFLISYAVYIVYDDFILINRITGFSDLALFIGVALIWFLIYFLGFSLYSWLIACAGIFIYVKLYKPFPTAADHKR